MISGLANFDYVDTSGDGHGAKRHKSSHRGNGVSAVPKSDVFPLLSLPEPPLCKIISCLSFRDICSLKKTSVWLNHLINRYRLECRPWFSRYSDRQRAEFRCIASNTSDKVLQAWIGQLTGVKKVARRLMKNRTAGTDFADFPETLFFAAAQMMAKATAFQCVTRLKISCRTTVSKVSVDGRFLIQGSCSSVNGPAQVDVFDSGNCGNWYQQVRLAYNGVPAAVVFSRDGRYLALGAPSDCAIIYRQDLHEGWTQCASIDHVGKVDRVLFSPDSRHLVTASSANAVLKVHTLAEDHQWLEQIMPIYAKSVDNVFFSDNSRRMLIIGDFEHGDVFGLNDRGMWEVQATVRCGTRANCNGISPFSADGNWMLTNDFVQEYRECSTTIHRLGTDGGWSKNQVIKHRQPVFMMVISASGRHVASTSHDGSIKTCIHNQHGWLEQHVMDSRWGRPRAAFSPDERSLLTHDTFRVRIFSLGQGGWVEKQTFEFYRIIKSANFSADSNHLLVLRGEDSATIFSRGAKNDWADTVTFNKIRYAAFSTNGIHLLVITTQSKAASFRRLSRRSETRNPGCVKIYGPVGNKAWQEKAVIPLTCAFSEAKTVSARFSPDDRHVLIYTPHTLRVVSIDNLPRTIKLSGL